MKFKEHHRDIRSWRTVDTATWVEGVGVWVHFQLGTENAPFLFLSHFTYMAQGGARGQNTTREPKIPCCKLTGREDRAKRSFSTPSLSSSGMWTLVVKGRIKLPVIIKQFLDLARDKLQGTLKETVVLEFSRMFTIKPGEVLAGGTRQPHAPCHELSELFEESACPSWGVRVSVAHGWLPFLLSSLLENTEGCKVYRFQSSALVLYVVPLPLTRANLFPFPSWF